MPVYEASALTTIVTASANTQVCAFRQIDNQVAAIREIHLFTLTAPTTSGGFGITRSTALGTGTLTTSVGVSRNPSAATTSSGIVTNWATAAPTISTTAYLRRWVSPASLGNGVIWTWDVMDPLLVAANAAATSELVLVNISGTAPGTLYITVVWEQ